MFYVEHPSVKCYARTMRPSDRRRKPPPKKTPRPGTEGAGGAVFPVMLDDGSVRWYRKGTGEPVDAPLDKAAYRPYNPRDAELVGQGIAAGMPLGRVLERLSIPRSTYNQWRRERPEFTAMIETGRRLRAESFHEAVADELVSNPVRLEADPSDVAPEELPAMEARNRARLSNLKVMEGKRALVGAFMKDDAPNRFGVQKRVVEVGGGGTVLNLGVDIPDHVARFIKEAFTPERQGDGGLKIKGLPEGAAPCDNESGYEQDKKKSGS